MKYIDADRLRKELDKRLKNVRDYMNGEGMKYKGPKYHKAQGKESSYDALLSIIDSLQQEPIEKDEETEKLIVCDIIEATIARINGGKKDEEKEENIMRKKIAYLRDLGLKNNDN